MSLHIQIGHWTRQQWGANQSLPRLGVPVAPGDRSSVHIHHTAGPNKSTFLAVEALEYVRALQTMRPDLGLDVPYNYVVAIFTDGSLGFFEGRGLERSSAHTKGSHWLPAGEKRFNLSGLSFGIIGNHQTHASPYDRRAMQFIGQWIAVKLRKDYPRLGTVRPQNGRQVFGHRDSDPIGKPECPGQYLYRHLGEMMLDIEEEDLMKAGDIGSSVERLQDMLREASKRYNSPAMNPGITDGIFGASTTTAVKGFQAYIGLSVSGAADAITLSILAAQTQGHHSHTTSEAW